MTRTAHAADGQTHLKLVPVSCPACDSDRRADRLHGADPLTGDEFDIVRCLECGLAYVHPRPADEHLGRYYPSDLYFAERHPFFKNQLMDLRARKLGAPPPGARLLDVGCGRGDFLLACKRKGWNVVGAEIKDAPIIQLRELLGIEVVTIDQLASFPANSFDAITLWHVFEHTTQPREMLLQIVRLLKPNGRLLIEVPNFGGWQARIARELWYHSELPRHLVHFDRRTLGRMLSAAHFEVLQWATFSLEYDTFGLLQGLLNRVCRTPNHLYQVLIGEPTQKAPRDTMLSFALCLPLGLFAAVVSCLAPLFGNGGVLRVVARKASA